MANPGDAAAAAGLEVFTGLEAANTIHDLLNIRGDEIAARTSLITPLARGGTGADNAAGARANLGAAATVHTHTLAQITGLPAISTSAQGNSLAQRDGTGGIVADTMWSNQQGAGAGHVARRDFVESTVYFARQGNLTPDVFNRNLYGVGGSEKRALYVADNGQIGYLSSTRDTKQDITPYTGDELADVPIVSYRYKADVTRNGPAARTRVGVVAEDVEDAGCGDLVYHDAGRPVGVDDVQVLYAMIAQLRGRVAELEARP